jgi:hypothetical protein
MEYETPTHRGYGIHIFSHHCAQALAGGMTVALTDVVMLTNMLSGKLNTQSVVEHESEEERPLADWESISAVVRKWHWSRKPLSSTVNILSVALYDLFGADGELSNSVLFFF